ncbi:unnamed protein product [Microthlaspi erraticum]|uniref:Uncharacterized protein n=1 Tax=Microthlaspi erraticum TaxID=1685480 RepID=A0A6D2IXC7_9BRAS|nr:unnamed protein product [Microthlaspi erraticum]
MKDMDISLANTNHRPEGLKLRGWRSQLCLSSLLVVKVKHILQLFETHPVLPLVDPEVESSTSVALRDDFVGLIEVDSESGEELDGFLLVCRLRIHHQPRKLLMSFGAFWSIWDVRSMEGLGHGRSSTGYAKEEGGSHLEDQLDHLLDQPVEFLNSTGQASTRSS